MDFREKGSSYSTARLLTVGAALYLIFVFYGSWVPLNFTPRPLVEAFQVFSALPFLDQSIDSATDWATNFLLLIPLTFLLTQRLAQKKRVLSSIAIRLALMGLGIATAFSLEFSQIYFPPRTVSQRDVLALSLGAVVGVAAQSRWGTRVENWLGMLWKHESQQGRLIRLLHVYLLVLFGFSVLPLDLTLNPVELYHKWSGGGVVLIPFGGLKGSFFDRLYETSTDLLIWIPVGLFLTLDRKTSLFRVAIVGWLAGAAIEVAQLFVYSRMTDVTDILLAGAGTAIGGGLVNRSSHKFAQLTTIRPGFWLLLWAGWAVAALCLFWFPFNFRASGVTLETAWTTFTRQPFLLLYQGSELNAVNEMLRKIGTFLPGGVLWSLGAAKIQAEKDGLGSKLNGALVNGALVFTTLALAVEGGQFFLPGKYADLTDVFLTTAGGVLGIILTRWVLSGVTPSDAAVVPTKLRKATSPPQGSMPTARTNHLLTFVGLTLVVSVVTRLPFVPYNVHELNAPGIAGAFSSLGLAMAVYWIANGHFLFLSWAQHERLIALPAWIFAHGFVAWIIIRVTIPMESIHDILGSPVLNWPWEIELAGRYLALHTVIVLQATGAAILLSFIYRRGNLASLVVWLAFSLILAWPLHWIVVEAAAADNLTELMRNGGNFITSTILASGVLAFFITGGAISAAITLPEHHRKALVWATIATLVALTAFWFGSEQVILKYGKVFSAWQFLLSTSRESYANDSELLIRLLAAYALMASVLGLIQASHIKVFSQNSRH